MRVIIKPAGLLLILVSLIALAALTMGRALDARSKALATPPTPMPLPRTTDGAEPSRTATSSILLRPDITSKDWQVLIDSKKSASADITVVSATVPGHPHARRIVVQKIGVDPWDVQLARPLAVSLQEGQKIQLTYWARSKSQSPITAVVEKGTEPYTRILAETEVLTPQWRQYTHQWTQSTDTPSNWAKMDFQLGHKVGEIELTGVVIRQLGNKN